MKKTLFSFLLFLSGNVLAVENGGLAREDRAMESRYHYWCLGDLAAAEKLLNENTQKSTSEEVYHRVDLLVARKKMQKAVELLVQALGTLNEGFTPTLLRRLYTLEPDLDRPFQEDNEYWVGSRQLSQLQKQGLAIKSGLIFQRRVDRLNPQKLLAFRLHSIEGRGQVVRDFGFELGDEIISVNGIPVSKWGFQEALSLAVELGIGQDLTVAVIPQGQQKVVTRVYHFRSDIEVIQRHLQRKEKEGN